MSDGPAVGEGFPRLIFDAFASLLYFILPAVLLSPVIRIRPHFIWVNESGVMSPAFVSLQHWLAAENRIDKDLEKCDGLGLN